MQIVKGQNGLKEFMKKNKKRMDQLHIRVITEEEYFNERPITMEEIRQFCEGLRFVHEAHLQVDPLKEVKEDKIAIIMCWSHDKDIEEEIRMYEMEVGIKIVINCDALNDDTEKREEKRKVVTKSLGDMLKERIEVNRILFEWEPTERDIYWLRNQVMMLNIGGTWTAPMGFIFEKTDENKLTLKEVNNLKSWIAIYQTMKIADKAGIDMIVDLNLYRY